MIQVVRAHAHLRVQAAVGRARLQLAQQGKAQAYPFGSPNPAALAATTSSSSVPLSQQQQQEEVSLSSSHWHQPFLGGHVPWQGAGSGDAGDRGVYWRDAGQSAGASDVSITIAPQWKKGTGNDVKVGHHAVPSHMVSM